MSASDDAHHGNADAATAGGPRGDRRPMVVGGAALLAAVFGYLGVRALVATRRLGDGAELLALPAFGLLGVSGLVLFVAPFLTR